MQSKMTEREFRRRFALRGLPFDGVAPDAAVEVAREAGLEFAPEPPSLPETVVVMFHGGAIELCPGGRTWVAGREEKRALYQEAKARYDAYPSLRAAAFRVLERAQNLVAKTYAGTVATPRWLRLRDSLAFLEDELAKGPK